MAVDESASHGQKHATNCNKGAASAEAAAAVEFDSTVTRAGTLS